MSYIRLKIRSIVFFDSYGMMSIGFFLVCVISGIFLAIPYDVDAPYTSIGTLMIGNPWGNFFRNTHYWSAQLFLIFAILHAWDYIKEPSDIRFRKGIWFRLVLSLLVIFWVMISGFILKADADSLQARRILDSLLSTIPLIGDILAYGVLGPENDFQIIYVHHIATTTIFLVIIIFEHAHTFWGKLRTFVISLVITSVFSITFQAPLHNNLDPIMKGPWYFLGLQEILHWLSRPAFSLIIIMVILTIIYFLPRIKGRSYKYSIRVLLYSFYVYLLLTIAGNFFRSKNWQWKWPWDEQYFQQIQTPLRPLFIYMDKEKNLPLKGTIPTIMDRKESCLLCHKDMKGFSPAHDPEVIGCVSCHGGNSFSLKKKYAHRGMILVPGNLTDAFRSCGSANCHYEIPERVNNSLMTTLSGMINVDRFVFGESASLSEFAHVHDLGQSAADNHLRDLCASCHLGNRKNETGPITELSRGGGCNACHLSYSGSALSSHINYSASTRKDTFRFNFHPRLSISITSINCFGCHSRSGRISTNYEGWHETQLDESKITGLQGYRVLEDHRVFRFVEDDIHHRKGLDCIDCHNSYELMGDGNLYLHKEQQVRISCEDCHFKNMQNSLSVSKLDAESEKIINIRNNLKDDHNFLIQRKSGIAILNTWTDQKDTVFLTGKNTNKIHPLLPPAEVCTQGNAHDNLSCSSCHTSWAPRCLGCHNDFEPGTSGFDIYANKVTKGSWVEYVGTYLASPPTLGVEVDTSSDGTVKKVIKTAVPGMILTIDKSNYYKRSDSEQFIFRRLFAPTEAHTIQSAGRSCLSCHNNSLAIGYGEGKLVFNSSTNKWEFQPKYQSNKYDGLPEDAWIGFLTNNKGVLSTRENFRPFNLKEQKNILLVGVCLTCHDENPKFMMESLDDFQRLIDHRSPECKTPEWQ